MFGLKVRNIIIIILFCFIFTSCDQFNRFRQEKYDCGNNSSGFKEIIFNKIKAGNEVKIKYNGKDFQALINEVKNNEVFINLENVELKVFTDKESVLIKEDNKITVLKCDKTIFKM